MKVCTDACLFGAWVASELSRDNKRLDILDIGTGTGLLSLMLMQKLNAAIDAVEIDKDAAAQADENVSNSPWSGNIRIHAGRIQEFRPGYKYDVVISNPPFFENDLRSLTASKNAAKHNATLDLASLLDEYQIHMSGNGKGFILLPYNRLNDLLELLKKTDFHIQQLLKIKQTVTHSFFRLMLEIGRNDLPKIESELVIQDSYRNYTPEFTAYLKDYYLNL